MTRRRLDAELVRRGLVDSRGDARDAIEAGSVLVGGSRATKAARLVDPAEAIVIEGPRRRFVGRGGEKLDHAIERFGLDVEGIIALDAGASTGGFTDALLQRGAAKVVAVDVGRNQLHERLRSNERVVSLERTDIRDVDAALVGGPFELVVADLSFISIRRVAAALGALVAGGGVLVVLVKPQFEAGRAEVSRGRGVISDPMVWQETLTDVLLALSDVGLVPTATCASSIRGAEGNVEFLALCSAGDPDAGVGDEPSGRIAELVADALRDV